MWVDQCPTRLKRVGRWGLRGEGSHRRGKLPGTYLTGGCTPPPKPAAPSSSSFCQPEPSEAAAATQPADIAMSPGHRARAGMVKEKGGLVHSGYEALSLPMAAQRNKPLICCELGLVQSLSQPERIGHAFWNTGCSQEMLCCAAPLPIKKLPESLRMALYNFFWLWIFDSKKKE